MTTELIASCSWTGEYGFAAEAKLIRNGDKTYLVCDHFCGMGTLDGGQTRPFVYGVPPALVESVRDCLDDPQSVEPGLEHMETTRLQYLLQHGIAALECFGRAKQLRWAKKILAV